MFKSVQPWTEFWEYIWLFSSLNNFDTLKGCGFMLFMRQNIKIFQLKEWCRSTPSVISFPCCLFPACIRLLACLNTFKLTNDHKDSTMHSLLFMFIQYLLEGWDTLFGIGFHMCCVFENLFCYFDLWISFGYLRYFSHLPLSSDLLLGTNILYCFRIA